MKIDPENMAELLISLERGDISGKIAKDVFVEMYDTGKSAFLIIKEKGLKQLSNTSEISILARKVIADHPEVVSDFRAGKQKAFGFFVGQIMKETRGQANPALVNEILKKELADI